MKRKIRNIICTLMALLMLLSVSACKTTGGNTADSETDGNSAAEQLLLADGSSEGYAIVIPQDCSTGVTSASTELTNAIKNVTGTRPDRYYDNTDKYDVREKEILLGLTSREESAALADEVQEDEYIIRQSGSKIVILGANEYLLGQAVKALIATWSVNGKQVLLPANLSLRHNLSENLTPLVEDGSCLFSIVYDSDLSVNLKNIVTEVASNLEKLLQCGKISVQSDRDAAVSGGLELLVGHTNRTQSDTAYAELTDLGYRIAMTDNKITVAATGDEMLERGVRSFYEVVENLSESTLVGAVKLNSDYALLNKDDVAAATWYTSVPTMTEGLITSGYSVSSSTCLFEREKTTAAGFRAYLAELEQAGFTGGEDYTLDGNLYALRYGEKATVYVSYSDNSKTTRLYVEKKGLFNYPDKGTASVSTRYEPVLWQLSVDSKGSKANGGMSYVMLTGNGTFVIIDGGYNTEAEADHLYSFLMEHKPEGVEKPVIEAWYLSHLHGDHFGGMFAFSKKYSKEIDVLSFYYHFDYLGNANATESTFMTYAQNNLWKDAVHYRLHTGMEFNLSGIQFHVLYTLEDLYPVTAADGIEFNNTSTVLRATVQGQRVLFLGDVMDLASNCMLENLSASTLKSDIVQFSHHGYEGGTRALYNAIAAPTVLWPLNVVGYQESGYSSIPQNVFKIWHTKTQGAYAMPNYYICYQATYVKQIIVAGMGDAEIKFPYTPTGDRLPDFNGYYDSNKSN